jgi:integrase
MAAKDQDELLTLPEVALRLKLRDRRTVLRQLESAGVAVIKVGRSGRVRARHLERMLDELEWEKPEPVRGSISEERALSTKTRLRSNDEPPGRMREASMMDGRRGWTETLGGGLYRRHRLSCRASQSKKTNVRCDCPFACHQPTAKPGRTSLKVIKDARTVADARKLKKRLQGAERPSGRDGDGTIKFDAFFRDFFLPVARLDESTKDSYRDTYEREIKPHFGHRRLCDITEEAVERWVRDLEVEARERRARTGRRATGWVATQMVPFRSALTHAVRWRRIQLHPFHGIELSEIEPQEPEEAEAGSPKKVLSKEQLQLLYTTARSGVHTSKHDRYEALIRCGSELAMRNGEIRGVRYSDFDLEAGKVKLQRQVDRGGRIKWLKGKEARTLPVTRRLLELVASLLEVEITRGGTVNSYVFSGHSGDPMARNAANEIVRRLLVRAGIVDDTGRHVISLHGLRHTCASFLFAEGVAPIKISRFLGHASLQVTLTTYAHLLSEDELDGLAVFFDDFNDATDELAA